VGTIVALPSGSCPFKIGQRVVTPIGSACAEYAVVPYWQAAALPDDIDPRDGVSMATQGLTAQYLTRECYYVRPGDWVLVRAAAGGVGLLLCQVRDNYADLQIVQSTRVADISC
jgi:NADPH2:quinone reductase